MKPETHHIIWLCKFAILEEDLFVCGCILWYGVVSHLQSADLQYEDINIMLQNSLHGSSEDLPSSKLVKYIFAPPLEIMCIKICPPPSGPSLKACPDFFSTKKHSFSKWFDLLSSQPQNNNKTSAITCGLI